nr:MAG TPA: hypothetical protein [Caudoviricetes sp.]
MPKDNIYIGRPGYIPGRFFCVFRPDRGGLNG